MKQRLLCLLLLTLTSIATAQSTAFTYQGHLMDAGASANGNYDLQFTLKNALSGGSTVGTPQAVSPVAAVNGIFTVTLDFGSASFDGGDRWVELGVRPAGSIDAYTVLAPRQRLTTTPYALRALSSTSFTGNISPAQIPSGTITAAMIANNTVGGTQLAPGLALGGTTTGTFSGPLTGNVNGNVSGSAASFTGSLAGNVTGTQGATLVGSVGGVTAANVASGANLANAATTASTPNTLVKRDSNGNIPGLTPSTTAPLGMVLIPAGAFTMGNSIGDGDITDATPIKTTVSAFYMDVNLVSLSQWQGVKTYADANGYTFTNAGAGKGATHPVQTVNWWDCVKWCNARSQQAGRTPAYYTDAGLTTVYKTGEPGTVYVDWVVSGYRLPTEAEWEKAARGGRSNQRFPFGNTISKSQANYAGDTASWAYDLGPNGYHATYVTGGFPYTSPVGSFAANGYGLNDMAGNVLQWCWDRYGTPYAGGSDPYGPASGSFRVLRGCSWVGRANNARCAERSDYNPTFPDIYTGFRAVLPPGQP